MAMAEYFHVGVSITDNTVTLPRQFGKSGYACIRTELDLVLCLDPISNPLDKTGFLAYNSWIP